MDNTANSIRAAIQEDTKLRGVTKVYVQGSYRNRVNVRQDSDVDVGVLYTGPSFVTQYPTGMSDSDVGLSSGSYSPAQFKDDIGAALVNHFGAAAVKRGNKAFDVHENSNRVEADVVPTFVNRRYKSDRSYISGVALFPDSGGKIPNWPERLFDEATWPNQHYENGNAKNEFTKRRYRGVVRIMKCLRNEMEEKGFEVAKPIKGFLVECLVWNVPNSLFGHQTWDGDLQAALGHLWTATKTDESCADWGEVSELIYLFRNDSAKRAHAYAFLDAAWSCVGVRPAG